MIQIAFC